jgi:hypothetical protein
VTFSIDHIDPRSGHLVCGLCVRLNECAADHSYNSRKTNRFVPYRLEGDVIVHVEFGDWGTFLIGGEWMYCEFGGPEWWEESNRIGNSCTVSGKISGPKNVSLMSTRPNTVVGRKVSGGMKTPAQTEARRRVGQKNSLIMNSHPNTLLSRERNLKIGSDNHLVMNIHPNTVETRKKNARDLNSQVWESVVDGYRGSASSVSKHNKKMGWDTTLRKKVNPNQERENQV